MKLDPDRRRDPLVWSFAIPERGSEGAGGAWATPALYGEMVYIATNYGDLIGLEAATGRERWRIHLAGPTWSSPVPVDDVLLQGDCGGTLHAFDISKPFREPPELWSLSLGSCIESTPSVFDGMIWVGTRGGGVYGDRRPPRRLTGGPSGYRPKSDLGCRSSATRRPPRPPPTRAGTRRPGPRRRCAADPEPLGRVAGEEPDDETAEVRAPVDPREPEREQQVEQDQGHRHPEVRGREREVAPPVVVGDERPEDPEDRPRRADPERRDRPERVRRDASPGTRRRSRSATSTSGRGRLHHARPNSQRA